MDRARYIAEQSSGSCNDKVGDLHNRRSGPL